MWAVIGGITPPPGVAQYIGSGPAGSVTGLVPFLSNLIKFLAVVAGLYTLLNLILAGYGFMSAGGDPKGVEKAWNKIWQSLVGLLIVAGAFVLAAIFGWILFKDPTAILAPRVWGPQ